jgi:hypothetical protein
MSLSDLAAIGSIISGVAVVFSFVFLTLQIRQANLNQRSLMQQARSGKMMDIYMKMAEPELSAIIVRADRREADMTAEQVQSFYRIWGAWFRQYENTFQQYKAGTIEESGWQGDIASMTYLLSSPAARSAWRAERLIIGASEFRDVVDKIIQDTRVLPVPFDYAKAWRKRLSEELVRA